MSTYRERLEAEIVDLRDTLDAARRQREEEHRLRRRAEAKVARVEALAEEWSIPAVVDGFDATADFADAIHNDGPWRFARDFRAALAEPERDKEGGDA